jgi:hypothetical protein
MGPLVAVIALVGAILFVGGTPTDAQGQTCDMLITVTAHTDIDGAPDQLREAIDDLCDGGTIEIEPGTIVLERLNLIVPSRKTLTIVGLPVDADEPMVTLVGNGATSRVLYMQPWANVTLESLKITNGYDPLNGGGGIYVEDEGTLNVTNSTIEGNTTAQLGGGLYVDVRATAVVTDSTIGGNTAGWGGGGIYTGRGALTVTSSSIEGNTSGGFGGGISVGDIGTLNVTNSSIVGNTASNFGGGISNLFGSIWLMNSTVSGNKGRTGGGISNYLGSTWLTNSTVSGNRGDYAGGIYSINGRLTVVHATVAFNTAGDTGGGIYNDNGELEMSASILDENWNSTVRSDCYSSVSQTSGGYNFIGDSTGCKWTDGVGDVVGQAGLAGLLPLQDNGGSTETHALMLLPASYIVDTIPTAACVAVSDQRGVARPQGAGCERGAFEFTPPEPSMGLVDPSTGIWRLRYGDGVVSQFYYGDPGDYPFMGDWDCDGLDTPGLYRQSDGFAYLRNSSTQGNADLTFFFGNLGDIPLAGDFNGDGCDTLSIYRPSESRFYIINAVGKDGGGLGAADYSFLFGNPGDKPVVGDWDGDGVDAIGLNRETTGLFYYRNTLTTGIAGGQFYFGDPGDLFIAGDWGVVDGTDTPGLFRPSNTTFYFRHILTQGNADSQFTWKGAGTNWLPVSGDFTLD